MRYCRKGEHMVLVIGGSYQGKYQVAEGICRREGWEPDIWNQFHEYVRTMLSQGKTREDILRQVAEKKKYNPNLIIVCNEVGSGIVPMEKEERIYREEVGRICCILAKNASQVIRVVCGVGTEIKHE